MDSSFDKEQKRVLYLVQWKSYLQEKDWTEEPYENFINAIESLRTFHHRNPDAVRDERVK
jgi:hypothetical protein